VLSIALSWALGELFGAEGAIVLVGSILSSVLTQPVHAYRARSWNALALPTSVISVSRSAGANVVGRIRAATITVSVAFSACCLRGGSAIARLRLVIVRRPEAT
jgi:hypothetical protein